MAPVSCTSGSPWRLSAMGAIFCRRFCPVISLCFGIAAGGDVNAFRRFAVGQI